MKISHTVPVLENPLNFVTCLGYPEKTRVYPETSIQFRIMGQAQGVIHPVDIEPA